MQKTLIKVFGVGLWFYFLVSACTAAGEQRWEEASFWSLFVFGSLILEKMYEIVFHLMAVNFHLLKLIGKEKQNDSSSS